MKIHSLLFLFIFLASTLSGEVCAQTVQPIVLGADNDDHTYIGKLAQLIYTEAFRRLDMPFKLEVYPLKRIEVTSRAGQIDGEAGRTLLYGKTRSDLILVNQPIMYFSFALYTADNGLKLQSLGDIKKMQLMISYHRGNKVCEDFAKSILPEKNIEDVSSTKEGIKKILFKRSALFCDLEPNVNNYVHTGILSSSEVQKIKKAFVLKNKMPIYPFLIKKHASLAKKLEVVLKQMKTEGLLDKYAAEAEKEFGYSIK